MEEHERSVITVMDEFDDIAKVITFVGVGIGAKALDDYERDGAQAVLEWAAERVRDGIQKLGGN